MIAFINEILEIKYKKLEIVKVKDNYQKLEKGIILSPIIDRT